MRDTYIMNGVTLNETKQIDYFEVPIDRITPVTKIEIGFEDISPRFSLSFCTDHIRSLFICVRLSD